MRFAAGLFEFLNNNTFGATVFSSYGAFWTSYAGYAYFIVPQLVDAGVDPSQPTGLFLFAWLIFSSLMLIASLRVSVAVAAIFVTLVPTLLLLTIGELAHNAECTQAGGWMGIICACCAWYGMAAVSINTTYGAVVLPVGTYVQHDALKQSAESAAQHWAQAAGRAGAVGEGGGEKEV